MNNAKSYTVAELVKNNIIEKPYDGNHGAIHPKGKDFINSGIPFIMASDVENAKIDLKNCKFISKKQADTLRKGFAIEGDVLLTHKASIGRTAVVPPIDYPYIMLTPQVTYYRIKNKKVLNNYYLKYYFDSKPFQEVLGAMAGAGSTRAYLGIIGQQDLPVVIPDISIQQKIATVLSALDAKIELNQRINAELESMAKTLYDYWFVQFDFPNEKGKPYKSAGGKMVWNDVLKREIPLGWEVESIEKCCEIIDCLHSKKPDYEFEDERYYLLQLENIRDDGLLDLTNKYFVPKNVYKTWISRIEVTEDDILITNAGRVAATAQVPTGIKSGIGRNITAIRPKSVSPTYLFLAFRGIDIRRQIKGNTDSGAFFSSFNVKGIKKLLILRPQGEIEKQFEKTVKAIRRKRELNNIESQTLTEVRDWLLPMLMNGQVKVG